MPNLTSVGVVSGVPNSGTGTVSTIDALMALVGEVQASPTSLTLLDRLKTLNTSKVEDAAHSSGDTGTYILAVRSDAPAASGDTNGDYSNININANGQVYVESGDITNPTSTLTRPADTNAYVAGDLLASSTTAGSIVVPTITVTRFAAGAFRAAGFRLVTNKTSGMDLIGLRVRLWSTAPTFTNGDNGVYAVATGAAGYLGKVDFILEQLGDGAVALSAPAEVAELLGKLASGTTIAWDLQTLNDFTPASGQTFILTAFIERK